MVVMILALQETTNAEDDSPEIIPQDDDEGPTCGCCGLRKWRTSWDLRLSVRYTATFEDLQDAAKGDCQDCELILEVILAYIAPKITLHKTRISVRPYPQERRIYVHLKPKWDSEEEYAELEVLRYSDRLPISPKSAVIHQDSGLVWDIITQSPSPGDNLPRLTRQHINEWIYRCCKDHSTCEVITASPLPKRVLQLSSAIVHVRETQEEHAAYACLSHCWGKSGPQIKLTSNTIDQLKQGLLISHLPRTFRDAVRVCQSLHIPYLWIDALCIKQDDLGDWKETAAQMASIFENAFVTLAAMHSPDSNGGLFTVDQDLTPRRLPKQPNIYVKVPKKTSRLPLTYRHFSTSTDSKHMRQFPLLFRAWVYQERRLSQRIIHFTQYQVFWECKSSFVSEDNSINTLWDKYESQNSRAIHARPFGIWSGDPIADWKKTVSEFQGLQLTFESDRLPAIAALAERMMHIRKGEDTYIAGMWKNTILADLCWYHFGRSHRRPACTIPSWSWASIQGNIMWADTTPLPKVEVLDVQYTAVGPTNIGEVVNASIMLRGRVVEGTYEILPIIDERLTVPCGVSMVILGLQAKHSFVAVTHFYPDFTYTRGSPAVEPGDALTGILIYRERLLWTGLVLRCTSDSENKFERIGLFSVQHKDYRIRPGISTGKEDDDQVEEYVNSLPLKELYIV